MCSVTRCNPFDAMKCDAMKCNSYRPCDIFSVWHVDCYLTCHKRHINFAIYVLTSLAALVGSMQVCIHLQALVQRCTVDHPPVVLKALASFKLANLFVKCCPHAVLLSWCYCRYGKEYEYEGNAVGLDKSQKPRRPTHLLSYEKNHYHLLGDNYLYFAQLVNEELGFGNSPGFGEPASSADERGW